MRSVTPGTPGDGRMELIALRSAGSAVGDVIVEKNVAHVAAAVYRDGRTSSTGVEVTLADVSVHRALDAGEIADHEDMRFVDVVGEQAAIERIDRGLRVAVDGVLTIHLHHGVPALQESEGG